MNIELEIVSLLALFLAILFGFLRNANVGIVSIACAVIIGLIYNISTKEILRGFSTSLAIAMIGVTYLFGIVSSCGALDITAKKIVTLIGKRTYFIPIAIFFVGMLLCGIGPGAIPTLAILPVLAVPIAIKSGYNPLLLSVIGQMGVMSARMSIVTPEAVLVQELMNQQGIEGSTFYIMAMLALTGAVMAITVFILFRGWRLEKPTINLTTNSLTEKYNSKQIIALVGVTIMILAVMVLGMNVGLASFLVGTTLIILGIADENKAIKSIPWNVLLMVLGVGILMNIVVLSGGIKVLTELMLSIMSPNSASAVMVTLAGIMSLFSSGLGVVFPTLIPTCGDIAISLGDVNALELVAMVVIGGTVTGFSPVSTTGALAMAAVSSAEGEDIYPRNKMFMQLIGIGFLAMVISILLAISGIYTLILTLFGF